jgi:phage baseplate assembly protein gpV
MDGPDNNNILENLVRIGTVSAVDNGKRKARVLFRDTGIVSDWLGVLQHFDADIYVDPDGEHTHTITDTYTGGGSASTEPDHDHTRTNVTYWMPKVNDEVVVLYLPVRDGDGIILGGL